eukprot:TRINITY_DN4299_c0_g1_i2.p1 TRINITY_DN4299_c0_g1~~TRINITY_DN4299_c0_g1_i2.p1  ORF type:complete len:587 (+),score=139.94 TRINITY_DN4299_c0_g1_i2:152-1912(+)
MEIKRNPLSSRNLRASTIDISTKNGSLATSPPNSSDLASSLPSATSKLSDSPPMSTSAASPVSPTASKGVFRKLFSKSTDVIPSNLTSSTQNPNQNQHNAEVMRETRNSIHSFVKSLLKRKQTPDQQRDEVEAFIKHVDNTMQNHPHLKRVDPFEMMTLKEEMKTELFSKLFSGIFETDEDKAEDEILSQRISKLSTWVLPKHLEIHEQLSNSSLWDAASKELLRVNTFVTPKEKLTAVLNCCKIIIYLLQEGGSVASADDFLPQLIYIVIKTNLPRAHSNIKFVTRFVDSDEVNGETFCFFTHLVSAVTFVSILDHTSLNISQQEFNRFMGIEESKQKSDETKKATQKALKLLGVDRSAKKVIQNLGITDETLQPDTQNKRNSMTSDAATQSEKRASGIPDASTQFPIEGEGIKVMEIQTGNAEGGTESGESRVGSLEKETWKDIQNNTKPKIIQSIESLEVRYPFLRKNANELRIDQIGDLLNSYKELCLHILVSGLDVSVVEDQISLLRPLRLKVRARGQQLFYMINLKKLRLESLHKKIKKRLQRTQELQSLVLLPDCIIEQNADLSFLRDGDSLEVEFVAP